MKISSGSTNYGGFAVLRHPIIDPLKIGLDFPAFSSSSKTCVLPVSHRASFIDFFYKVDLVGRLTLCNFKDNRQ